MPSPSLPLPTWWINIWIALGTATFLLIIMIPAILFTSFTQERYRFDQCAAHKRADCNPSMIWFFSGWSGPTSTRSGVAPLVTPTTTEAIIVPSSTIPVIQAATTTTSTKPALKKKVAPKR